MPFFQFVLILPFLLLGALAACSRTPASRPASSNTPAASTAPVAAMPAHPTTSAAPSPVTGAATSTDATGATAGAAAPTAVRTATGVVTETMDAADYTYVRLDTGTEQIWAATSKTKVKVGDRLAVPLETPMRNFHSEKLGRDFRSSTSRPRCHAETQAPARWLRVAANQCRRGRPCLRPSACRRRCRCRTHQGDGGHPTGRGRSQRGWHLGRAHGAHR